MRPSAACAKSSAASTTSSCRGCRCSASCSVSTCRRPRRRAASTSASCATRSPTSRCASSSTRLGGTATMLAVEDVQFMDEASADLLVRLSRAAGSLRYVLVVTHSDPATTWAPVSDEDLRCLAFTLRPLTDRQAAEIVEIATDDHPLQPARRRGDRPTFGRQRAVSLRVARHGPRDGDDRQPCPTRSRRLSPRTSTGSLPSTGWCCATPRCSE